MIEVIAFIEKPLLYRSLLMHWKPVTMRWCVRMGSYYDNTNYSVPHQKRYSKME